MVEKHFFVYILASKRNGTLYVGVTANLGTRISIHREDLVEGFTRRYGVHQLVWYEWLEYAEPAIRREKQIKKWNRAWKIRLIEEMNPSCDDLYPTLPPTTSFPRRRESRAATTGAREPGFPAFAGMTRRLAS